MKATQAIAPSALSAYSVVGEREQGTLEPVLITPIRREEFPAGKALAVLIPALMVSYAIFGVFLVLAALVDGPGWRAVAGILDRERLVVGTS